MLAKGFLPVNLNQPGLRVQNIDPPVLTVEQFLPDEVCDALREAAKASGKMKVSGVGGTGDLKDDIRTSSTLAITKEVRREAAAVYRSVWQCMLCSDGHA
jgi:collagen type III alpha